jgi:nucleoside-diphosphate-sugar epimerase
MRALVTGCAGFIGSHLSEALIEQRHEVIGIDCFTDYYPRPAKEANLRRLRDEARFSLHEADLAEVDLRPVVEGVEVVYHQAAQAGVRASWGTTFDVYARNNVIATQRLLEAVKDHPLTKFVYASSSSVYGDAETFPTNETALPCPVSPYGVTKLAGEQLTYLYHRNYGVPTAALRYFTVYGPRQRPDMAFRRFIDWVLHDERIQVYGDGNQTRDFTFVSDVVAANIAAGASNSDGETYNIGGGSRTCLNEIIVLLGALMGRKPRVDCLDVARGDVRHTSADTRRACELLDYVPKVDIRQGLAVEVEWVCRRC